jgi:hypothetical protein
MLPPPRISAFGLSQRSSLEAISTDMIRHMIAEARVSEPKKSIRRSFDRLEDFAVASGAFAEDEGGP